MDKLKPCPFCGGEAGFIEPIYVRSEADYPYVIECSQCGIQTSIYNNQDQAIAAWNRRVEPQGCEGCICEGGIWGGWDCEGCVRIGKDYYKPKEAENNGK